MNPSPESSMSLPQQVRTCAANPAFLSAIQLLYRAVDEQIAALAPHCRGCGGCCHFDLAGHRLYVSTGELALLLRTPPAVTNPPPLRCPYQVGAQCRAREYRPLGCRTYFCDRKLTNSIQDIYENSHIQLRLLHQNHYMPYTYAEMTHSVMQSFST